MAGHDQDARPTVSASGGTTVVRVPGAVQGMYGLVAVGGAGPRESAAIALQRAESALGIRARELVPEVLPGSADNATPLLTNPTGAGPKFWFYSYQQAIGGIPVLGTRVGVLVRNATGFPVVAVKAHSRVLDGFVLPSLINGPAVAAAMSNAIERWPGLGEFSSPEVRVWAGTDAQPTDPRAVIEFFGDGPRAGSDRTDRVRVIADAVSGEVVACESVRCDSDIQGTTRGLATQGLASDACSPEISSGLPRLGIVLDGTIYYSDASGAIVIPWAGTSPVALAARVSGERFATHRMAGGADEAVTLTVVPPGPAAFVFNATDTTPDFRSAVNSYLHANVAYDFIAANSPWVSQSECSLPFDVNIHKSNDGSSYFTPSKGDRCSDGNRASINFGAGAGGTAPSPAFSTLVYHEYGHFIVSLQGYTGSSPYNEGMADTIAMLVSDQPDVGLGLGGDCGAPLRSAENTMSWPCYDPLDVHTCGSILSGCFWELRKNLSATNPGNYRHLLADLALGSIAMHVGASAVDPSVFLDVLTLDNDDVLPTSASGSPHWREIQSAFEAHRMTIADFDGAGTDLQPGPLAFAISAPTTAVPGTPVSFNFKVSPMYGSTPLDGQAWLYTSTDGGVFAQHVLERLGPNHYAATFSVPDCGERVRYYLAAKTTDGRESRFPAGAPDQCVTLTPLDGAHQVVAFRFDNGLQGWTTDPAASFSVQRPLTGLLNNDGMLPTFGPDLAMNKALFVSSIPLGEGNTDASCAAVSPTIDSRGHGRAMVSYARWFHEQPSTLAGRDFLTVDVSPDNGVTWVTMDQAGPGGSDVNGGWRFRSFLIEPSATTRLRVKRHDAGQTSQAVVYVDDVVVTAVKCCPSDFNDDGFVTADDYDAFVLEFFDGNATADFNNDGFVTGDDFDEYSEAFVAGC